MDGGLRDDLVKRGYLSESLAQSVSVVGAVLDGFIGVDIEVECTNCSALQTGWPMHFVYFNVTSPLS